MYAYLSKSVYYSTFFYSVQDAIEFTEKLVEDIGILFICYSEFLPGFLTMPEFIGLINDMKTKFSIVDAQTIQKLKREEKLWFLKLCVIASTGRYFIKLPILYVLSC